MDENVRCRERIPDLRPNNTQYNDIYKILTFQQVLDLAKEQSEITGREIGVYVETKHPAYFKSIGMGFDDILLDILNNNGYDRSDSPVMIQSFGIDNLKEIRKKTKLTLVHLVFIRDR